MREVVVIHNPAAGGRTRARFAATVRRLEGLGCRVEVRGTAGPGEAEALARQAVAEGWSRVVVAGGDGTINEALNALAGSATALGLIPLGTANVLAREIGLEEAPATVARAIVSGAVRPVCLGRLSEAGGRVRSFALMAGAGFDAHVVAGVGLGLKRRIGKGAYVLESLRQLALFPFPTYRVTVDGRAYEPASVVVAKARHYGGAYTCAPAARLDEPRFHVGLFERRGPLAAARYALALVRGTLAERADYRIVTGARVTIEGPAGDPVQVDGDVLARLPIEIEMVPDALDLIVPADGSGR